MFDETAVARIASVHPAPGAEFTAVTRSWRHCGDVAHTTRKGLELRIRFPPMESGTRLGPYEILEQLGAGGMGEVYVGQDTRLGRRVAVKVLPPAFASDADRLARFELRERQRR